MNTENKETTQVEETKLTPDQQIEMGVKVARGQHKALANLVRLDIRNYLAQLSQLSKQRQSGPNLAKRKRIEQSLENAIIFSFDYGADVVKQRLSETGELAYQENAMAAHMCRLKETGMLIIADKLSKQEAEVASDNNIENKTEQSGETHE